MRYPDHLIKLIQVFKKLPGVGQKSAERFAYQLLNWPQNQIIEMADVIVQTPTKLIPCPSCGCLMDEKACLFCHSSRNESQQLCIIASPRDAFAIEETKAYHGLYHVLGSLFSPLDHKAPDPQVLISLKERIFSLTIREVVIALDSTLEGDATSLYLKQELSPLGIQTSRLAFGLPMGSAIDYVDGCTLARAFSGRNKF